MDTQVKRRKPRSDRMHVIYRVTCTATAETYVGLTVCAGNSPKKAVEGRWQRHVTRALTQAKDWALCKAIRQHGAEMKEVHPPDLLDDHPCTGIGEGTWHSSQRGKQSKLSCSVRFTRLARDKSGKRRGTHTHSEVLEADHRRQQPQLRASTGEDGNLVVGLDSLYIALAKSNLRPIAMPQSMNEQIAGALLYVLHIGRLPNSASRCSVCAFFG